MYKSGKLTKDARAKLEKRYAKERAKDCILSKIDKKQRKRNTTKKSISTTNKINIKSNKENVSALTRQNVKNQEKRGALPSRQSKKRSSASDPFAEPNINHSDNISECPSTPPRNGMVKEREMIMQANKGVNWVSLTNHNQSVATAENELHFELCENAKKDFKLDLMQQMEVREKIRQKERQEVLDYQQEQQELYKSWEGEDYSKLEKKHAKVEELKAMREEQIVELESKREKLYRKELRREIRQAKKNEAERIQYEQDIVDRKIKKHEEMQEVLVENAKYKAIVLEEQKKLAEEDIRLQKQYAEMLKNQEEARSKRLTEMFAQAEEKAGNLLDFTAVERKKLQEIEDRAARELKQRLAADDEKNRLKKERLHKENLEVQEYLRNQILEKEKKLKDEIVLDREWGHKMAADAVKSLKNDENKVEQRKAKLYEQSDYIKNQIKENEIERIEKRADMTNNEKEINMGLIRQVQDCHLDVKEMPFDPKRPFAWRYNYRSKPF